MKKIILIILLATVIQAQNNSLLLMDGGYKNQEVKDWIVNIKANGGTASATTLNALDVFFTDIASIKTYIKRMNLFCGSDTGACFIPQIHTIGYAREINVSFVPADYSELTGLKGDGSSKRLRTGMVLSDLDDSTKIGVGLYIKNKATTGGYLAIARLTPTGYFGMMFVNGSYPVGYFAQNNSAAIIQTVGSADSVGFFFGQTYSATAARLFFNGSSVGGDGGVSPITLYDQSTTQFNIFAIGNGATTAYSYSDGRFAGYVITEGLISTGDAAILNTAIEKFQDALGRGVQ